MNPRKFSLVLAALAMAATDPARADVVTLKSGTVVHGTIIQKDSDNILILADYGTTTVPAGIVSKIEIENDNRPVTLSTNTASGAGRLPEWRTIISQLATKGWADKLRQIPATVITNGVLRNVPYISFRCGVDYEVNIYGDLDNPAGIEMGFYRSLLANGMKDYASGKVVGFVGSVLQKDSDRVALGKLNLEKDMQVIEGLTMEVTPETAVDSYGGWWVSVYSEKALDEARVSDKDLATISVLNSTIIKEPDPVSAGTGWTRADLKYARPVSAAPTVVTTPPPTSTLGSYSDLVPTGSGGSHYVHGYYRKNGTYVSGYYRSR